MEDLKLDLDNFYIYIYIKTEQKNWKGEIHNSYDHTQCNKLIAPNEKHVQQFYHHACNEDSAVTHFLL